MNQTTTHALTIPFYGDTLYLVEHNGEPYTPMKPIVEQMGLAWQPQHRKFQDDPDRFSITLMVIQLPGDVQNREVLLMPVRKLFGWLMTVSPNRVKPAIRDKVIRYQKECDDILWEHWSKRTSIFQELDVQKVGKLVSLHHLEVICGHRREAAAAVLYYFIQNEHSELADDGWFYISARKLSVKIGFSRTSTSNALNSLQTMDMLVKYTEVNAVYLNYYQLNHKMINRRLKQNGLPVIQF